MTGCSDIKSLDLLVYLPNPENNRISAVPQLGELNAWIRKKTELAREFGLTPSARSRLQLPEAKSSTDEMEKLLRGG